ncbi:mechanosensitive ion channel [bacterium]|nr:MAG: mechanosensitive ion channel [bacterium]
MAKDNTTFQQLVDLAQTPKKLHSSLLFAFFFFLFSFGVRSVLGYLKARGIGSDVVFHTGDKAFILFMTIGVVFALRWLMADAPFSFLRKYTVAPLIRTISTLLIYFGAIFFLLHRLLGINLTPLLTTSAVLTGVLILSLQDTIKNLFTGLWINMERIVAKGDWVKVGDKEGKVMEVTWRTTRLLTRDNDYIYLPNRILAEGIIENYTFPSPLHVVDIDIAASYKDPPNIVSSALLDIALGTPSVLANPKPEVWLTHFSDFSVSYRFRVYISDYRDMFDVKSELNRKIWYAFRRKGIEIPLPTRVLYHHKPVDTQVPQTTVLASLKNIDFLSFLSEEAMKDVAASATLETFGDGEVMVRQGEQGTTCYFIQSGTADVLAREASTGKDVYIASLKQGAFFGEMSLFTGEPRRATVVAKEDTVCLVIGSAAFKKIFVENPNVAEKLSSILAKRATELKEATAKSISQAEDAAQKKILHKIKSFFNIN